MFNLIGCAEWSPLTRSPEAPQKGLKSPKMPLDAVAVDLIFIRLAPEEEDELESVWRQLDEQAIDIEHRRALDANGIRVGVAPTELPIAMQRWVEKAHQKIASDLLEQAALAADVSSHVQKLQCRAGKRKEIVVRPQRSTPLILLHNDGVAKGRSYDDPMLVFELKAIPNPNGSASLRLTPEVQYGPLLPNYVGQDLTWHREFRRANDRWEDAAVETQLLPGQILVIGGTQVPKGIGEHFLWTETHEKQRQRVLLLVRYSGSQLDELYRPENAQAVVDAIEG